MSQPDFSKMTTEDFAEWQRNAAGVRVEASALPSPAPPQVAATDYAGTANAWVNGEGYDWTSPQGHKMRLRPMPIEELAAAGLLDKLTRLEGVVQTLISKSEGQPPAKPETAGKAIAAVTEVLNQVIPMVVVNPTISPIPPEGEERKATCIYPESIPFGERMAILTEVTGGLLKWDGFRQQS